MNDRGQNAAAETQADARQDQPGNKRPDDPDDDVAKQAEPEPPDDLSGQPAGNRADDQQDEAMRGKTESDGRLQPFGHFPADDILAMGRVPRLVEQIDGDAERCDAGGDNN